MSDGAYWSEFTFQSAAGGGPEYAVRLFSQIPQHLPVQLLEGLTMQSNSLIPLSAGPCIALLRELPTLKTLSLDRFSPLVLHALILTTDRVCPLLHELSIIDSEISSEKLIELITSRTVFGTDDNLPPDGTTHLRLLKLQGIRSISLLEPDVWEPGNRALSDLPLLVVTL
ncbi:hypothetical protein BOTBODRAFT_504424 [Botryobasidium botryosum FD-172 SS1]|uniref:F-box domain-containing protein n=1 Tax=Botryobasidium botryosum (strain FD-172 SS1) TaxID=930990 RepID=A0A067M393_BOTB1|nr:hypothetical protein BOTBODRAFT_504424 [Botryobasidium botryosum FD-172 SS1]